MVDPNAKPRRSRKTLAAKVRAEKSYHEVLDLLMSEMDDITNAKRSIATLSREIARLSALSTAMYVYLRSRPGFNQKEFDQILTKVLDHDQVRKRARLSGDELIELRRRQSRPRSA